MITNAEQRIMRRLTKAEGYLELGMPDQALSELRSIDDPGAFSVPHLLMTAAALKALGKTEEASESLRKVASNLPKISGMDVWKVLGKFLKKLGQSADSKGIEKIVASMGLKPIAMGVAKLDSEDAASINEFVEKMVKKSDDEIRVEIPQFGTLAVKIEPGQSLTIKIDRPKSDADSTDEVNEDDSDIGNEVDDEDE